ncbi:hypothetical protein AX17_005171 [Amanita inopinata Kibby_2008]|nr:hypothetical protein AX17_005171 [Amanita inopinata Kibby_2008]
MLFGRLKALLYTAHEASTEIVVITELEPDGSTLKLDSLMKPEADTSLGAIALGKPHLMYYARPSPVHKVGLWLEADIGFQGPLQKLKEDMVAIFGPQGDHLHFSAQLSLGRDWTKHFTPQGFTLCATVPQMSVSMGKRITFTSMGIGLSSSILRNTVTPYMANYLWTYSFFGKMTFDLPGSCAPFLLDYRLEKEEDCCLLYLNSEESTRWDNAFGVRGLHLSEIELQACFSLEGKDEEIDFDMSAQLELESTKFQLHGFILGDSWGFSATADHLDWPTLCSFYEETFSTTLHDFDHDVTVSDLSLEVTSEDKLLTFTGSVLVHEYHCASATIQISNRGIHLKGDIEDVKFDGITIEFASLNLFIGKVGDVDNAGTSVSLKIEGKAKSDLLDHEVAAVVYLDKDPKGEMQIVVAGAFEDQLRVSDINHATSHVKGTPLDLELVDAAFIYCHTDTPSKSFPNALGVPIKKGMSSQLSSVCARIQQDVPGLRQTLRSEAEGLMVTAAITAKQVDVDIILSSPRGISFGANMKSTSLTVGIDISSEPYLSIIAGFAIKVAGQSDPLAFNLELKASDKKAVGSATIDTDWHNPFEISSKVTVLHPIALGAEIDYALVETGVYPSRLDFTAGLQVGGVLGRAALSISESPSSGVVQQDTDCTR